MVKCIILAGGLGTRLGPCTIALSKQVLPVYDKPMIYYSLSLALLAGLRDILIISSPEHIDVYEKMFESGVELGISIEYKEQDAPRGIAEAFLLGEEFLQGQRACLILGDNIFYGHGLTQILRNTVQNLKKGAQVFGYAVPSPQAYGVLVFDEQGRVLRIEEKPVQPQSKYAVPGLYFFDDTVVTRAKNLKPSARGELEITELNNTYAQENQLSVHLLGRGFAWFDTGNPDNLLDAANFIGSIERNQGIKISCIEEICYKNGWIDADMLRRCYEKLKNSHYGAYLGSLLSEENPNKSKSSF